MRDAAAACVAGREEVRCALCGGDEADVVLAGGDLSGRMPGQFTVRRCRRCGLQYVSPRPTAAAMLVAYQAGTFHDRLAASGWVHYEQVGGRRNWAEKLGRPLLRQVRQGRLLDIGCGEGEFLLAMQRKGWQVYGVDPDPRCAEWARQRGLANVQVGTMADVALPAGSLDAVTMWNVLEHLGEPLAALQKARYLLREGGVLGLCVPNAASVQACAFGVHWVGYDLPWHLYHFDAYSLTRLLALADFAVVERACLTGSYDAFVRSLLNLAVVWQPSGWLGQASRLVASSPLTRLAVKPANLLLDWLQRGPILTVIARAGVGAGDHVARWHGSCDEV